MRCMVGLNNERTTQGDGIKLRDGAKSPEKENSHGMLPTLKIGRSIPGQTAAPAEDLENDTAKPEEERGNEPKKDEKGQLC